MMNKMHDPEQRRMMHQPVHPVEISVVHEQHHQEGEKEIAFTVEINVRVESCVWPQPRIKQ